MQLKNRLDKLESIIKNDDSDSYLKNLSTEELVARIETHTCNLTGMSIDDYRALTVNEKQQLHSDMLIFLKAKKKGKTIKEALGVLKEKNPNYSKELEQCH